MATRKKQSFRDRMQVYQNNATAEVGAELEPLAGLPRPVGSIIEVPVEAISPNRENPRKDLGELADLAGSIKDHGVLQPLTVRPLQPGEGETYPAGTRYVLVMGERRWTAARKAGRTTVPVVLRDDLLAAERQVMLVENLLRKELDPVEEARAFEALVSDGLSQHEIARQLQLTQAHVSRRLSLLNLNAELLELVRIGRLSVDVACKEAARLPADQQQYLAEQLRLVPDITPEVVRSYITHAQWEAERSTRLAHQRAQLEDAGLPVFENRAALETEAGLRATRPRYAGPMGEVANTTGLAGVLDPLSMEPDLYFLDAIKPGDDATTTPPDTSTTGQQRLTEQQRNRLLERGMQAWVQAHPKPPAKSALTQRLAEHIVATAGRDLTWTACQWLSPRGIGHPVHDMGDWDAWRNSIEAKDAPRVAWMITVAADLHAARDGYADGMQATRARIAEVAPDLISELSTDPSTSPNTDPSTESPVGSPADSSGEPSEDGEQR